MLTLSPAPIQPGVPVPYPTAYGRAMVRRAGPGPRKGLDFGLFGAAETASDVLLPPLTPTAIFWSLLATAAAGASAYHGYKRNDSIGWAVAWGLLGGLFPVITVPVALAQGFGKRK